MVTASKTVSSIVGRVHNQAQEFALSTDELFLALDEERPVVTATMVPPIREAIAGMRAVLDEMENICNSLEK